MFEARLRAGTRTEIFNESPESHIPTGLSTVSAGTS